MKDKRFFFLTLGISLLALVLRLYRLGEIPISLHWDEASWAYNAWSILKTGRDEYGQFLPLIFKAFGDYKAPVYVYLTSLSMIFFGLTEFAVRFPAALFGALDVFLLAYFARSLFYRFKSSRTIGFLAAFSLALSPWHYDYSHGAWEANVLFAFYLLGLILFLRTIRGRKGLMLSAVFFSLCFYVYASAKLVIPLTAIGLILIYGREFFEKVPVKKIILALILVAVICLPVGYQLFFRKTGGRLRVMSVFSYPRLAEKTNEIARIEGNLPTSGRYRLFHSDFHYFFRNIFWRYLNHFSPRFLFFEGDWDDLRHGIPDFGVLNYLDLVFLPAGAWFLLRKKIKGQRFLWLLLLVAPLPAALSRDAVQSLRAYFMVLPLSLISAFGAYFLLMKLKRRPFSGQCLLGGSLALTYFFVFALFWDRYFVHAPKVNSSYWQYGYREAVEFVKNRQADYEKIVFTSKYGQPYIFYLLYSCYPPEDYQKQAQLIEHPQGDVGQVLKIDKIEFRELYWPKDRFKPGVLYVGATYEIPEGDIDPKEARVLKDIYFLNGDLAFRIAETY